MSDAARNCGISVSYLSLVESSSRQPSIDILRRLADVLGAPPEALVLCAMGSKSKLTANGDAVHRIAETVQELVAIEDKLRSLLEEKGDVNGGKRHNPKPHCRGTRP